MIQSICEMPDVLKVLRIVNIVILIIRIVVPIILIISAMIQLVKAVMNAELNKITKPMITKVVAAILIFMIPVFVRVVAIIAGNNREYEQCLKDISKETIDQAYQSIAESLVAQAEESKSEADIGTAEYYLTNIKDETAKTGFQERINKVKEEKEKENNKPSPGNNNTAATEPIKPSAGEKIIKQGETDTLKVYITKTGSSYVTRVWMKDPYNQVNKQDASPYGKSLRRPSELVKTAISEKGLENKLIVAMNASGFYLKNTYDASSVSRVPAYDRTSVGTIVITDGKVIRNNYEKGDLLTWFITGIDNNNQMQVFEDKKMKETTVSEKKAWSESVINSGIRNTFTFAAPVILNGQKTNYTNKNSRMPGSNDSTKGLQMMCQVDNNNFMFFSTKSGTRNQAIKIFLDAGCKTAVNLDGGGSVALLFKADNSSNIETVSGNARSLPEAMYITE